MDCIILAGGLGTRLRSVVEHLPKALAPIRGIPFLHLLMNQLIQSGCITKITLALGYLADPIIKAFQNAPFPIAFSCEETPLGTGGAIYRAIDKTTSDSVFVVNGDTYLDIPLVEMLAFHKAAHADITIACRKTADANRYGTIEMNDEGRIVSFREKGRSEGLISCGFYLFNRSLFSHLPFGEKFSLEQDGFPYFLKNRMFGFCNEGTFIDIGTPESFAQSQEILRPIL